MSFYNIPGIVGIFTLSEALPPEKLTMIPRTPEDVELLMCNWYCSAYVQWRIEGDKIVIISFLIEN